MGTHPELSDPVLREILANEMLIWRGLKRRGHNIPLDVKLGFFTALYRVQKAQEGGEK